MRNNPHQHWIPGLSIAPQAIGTTAANGTALVRPWEKARLLSFIMIGGALGAADAYTAVVQARRQGTSTWDDVKEADGTTNLQFTASKTSDTGALENGYVFGTVDLSRLRSGVNLNSAYEYDAIRISVTNANNTTPGVVGVAHVLSDLYAYASTDLSGNAIDDDLLFKQLPPTA